MKRLLLFMIPCILLVVGCNDKSLYFFGESDNWKEEYSANIFDNGTRENGEYVFGYKNATSDTTFKNLEIVINDGETRIKEDISKGATVAISTSCSGCDVTREDHPIKVTINWDDKKEESFTLEQK